MNDSNILFTQTPTVEIIDKSLNTLPFRNQLLGAASKILSVITQLKLTHAYQNAEKLKHFLQNELQSFQKKAEQLKYETESIFISRYILSATLDEIIEKTPWGIKSQWQNQALLQQEQQKETTAGERFFIILETICQNAKQFVDVIELMYICLSLGFEGKYKNATEAKQQLQQIKNHLYQLIRYERGEFSKILSPHLIKEKKSIITKKQRVSIWGSLISTILIIGCIYGTTIYLLNLENTKILQQLQTTVNFKAEP